MSVEESHHTVAVVPVLWREPRKARGVENYPMIFKGWVVIERGAERDVISLTGGDFPGCETAAAAPSYKKRSIL